MSLNERIIQVFNDSQIVTYDHEIGISTLRDVFRIAAADNLKKVSAYS